MIFSKWIQCSLWPDLTALVGWISFVAFLYAGNCGIKSGGAHRVRLRGVMCVVLYMHIRRHWICESNSGCLWICTDNENQVEAAHGNLIETSACNLLEALFADVTLARNTSRWMFQTLCLCTKFLLFVAPFWKELSMDSWRFRFGIRYIFGLYSCISYGCVRPTN